MSYPERGAGYRGNGKSVMRMAGAERAEGGSVEDRYMAHPNMKPTDPTVTADEVKTWGSADNARAAARAREHAKPITADEERGFAQQMQRPSPEMAKGLGRSIGFKRGGAVKRRADGGRLPEPLVDTRGRTLAQLAGDEPDGAPLSLKTPSSPGAAQDAREQAAKRTRNTRAMPNSFKVGGNE